MACWHFGQRMRRPAWRSSQRKRCAQCGQENLKSLMVPYSISNVLGSPRLMICCRLSKRGLVTLFPIFARQYAGEKTQLFLCLLGTTHRLRHGLAQ